MDKHIGPTGIDGVSYAVTDVPRAKAFYRDDISMTVAREFMDGAFVEYDLADGATFAIGELQDAWTKSQGIMFSVPDVAAATEKRRAAGHKVEIDSFATTVCFMSICEDPDGNTFLFHKRKTA